jgi:hypothetical protein
MQKSLQLETIRCHFTIMELRVTKFFEYENVGAQTPPTNKTAPVSGHKPEPARAWNWSASHFETVGRRQIFAALGLCLAATVFMGCTKGLRAVVQERKQTDSSISPSPSPSPSPRPSSSPTPTPTAPPVISNDILKPADFSYVGAMKVPYEISGFGTGAMTARKVGNQVSFFMTGHSNEDSQIYEFPFVGTNADVNLAPRSPVTTKWGDVYQGKKASWYGDGTEKFMPPYLAFTQSLLWHNDRLYWIYADRLNKYDNDFCIGMTDLKSSPDQMVAHGPWQFNESVDPGQQSRQTAGYMLQTPDGQLAVGAGLGAGMAFGGLGEGYSWGPVLRRLSFPADSNPGGYGSPQLSGTKLVGYPMDPARPIDGAIPPNTTVKRFRRDITFNFINTFVYLDPSPDINPMAAPNQQPYWTQGDTVSSAVWIQMPKKQGVLFFGELATGNVWFGTGNEFGTDYCANGEYQTSANGREPRIWIYDPQDLEKVARGEKQSWEIEPAYAFNPKTLLAPAMSFGCHPQIKGAWFDSETGLLFLSVPAASEGLPVIYVFKIAGA